jgi:hypothetical protein
MRANTPWARAGSLSSASQKMTPAVRPATQFDDRAVSEQMIVEVVRVGGEVTAISVGLEKGVDGRGGVIAAKGEDVEGMVAVADKVPQLPGHRFALHGGIEKGHLGGVGVDDLGLTHQYGHQVNDRL